MLNKLRVHGFRSLYNTEITFAPLTIMIGRNGVGKSSLLFVVETIGKYARGGADRAFGPPPWSLGWQKTKGIGKINTTDFELDVTTPDSKQYHYTLKLRDQDSRVRVEEERLTRISDNTVLASYPPLPRSGTILKPDRPANPEIDAVATVFSTFDSYELNPSFIERGNDPKVTYVGRDGFGVAGHLAYLKDTDPTKFQKLETLLKGFRPETDSIEVWSPSNETFWGLRDRKQNYPINALHLSWGDRQLVGLLCVLCSARPGSTVAIEEVDRGFHPSRYEQVIALLTDAAYEGLVSNGKFQVILTTHSPSFVNRLNDVIDNVRLVTRAAAGGTVAHELGKILQEKLGTDRPEQPIGEVWEMGLLEETLREAL